VREWKVSIRQWITNTEDIAFLAPIELISSWEREEKKANADIWNPKRQELFASKCIS
jgi:hypothetical protein